MFFRKLVFVCVALVLSSCATSGLVSSWTAPDSLPLEPMGARVGAVVMLEDEASRRLAEDELARQISARGAQGIPGYSVMPNNRPSTEPEARAAFEHADVQGIVVMRPVSTDREVVWDPVLYLGRSYYSYWEGYYGYGWGSPWIYPGISGVHAHTNTIVTVETLVYSLRQNKLVWAGKSKTVNPRNVQSLVSNLSQAVAMELQEQGLLAR